MSRVIPFQSAEDKSRWLECNCASCPRYERGCPFQQVLSGLFSPDVPEATVQRVGWEDGKISETCKMKEAV